MTPFDTLTRGRILDRWQTFWAFTGGVFLTVWLTTEAALWTITGRGSDNVLLPCSILAISATAVTSILMFNKYYIPYLTRHRILADSRKDMRPYFLLLRSFSDRVLSDIEIGSTVTMTGVGSLHPIVTRVEHVDSVVSGFADVASQIGRVVIIGRHVVPWHQTLRFNGLQIVTSDQAWQRAFDFFASRARVLIFVFGDTPSVRHELSSALSHYRERLYILVPPLVQPTGLSTGLLQSGRVSWDEHPSDFQQRGDSRRRTLAVLQDILGIGGNAAWTSTNAGVLLHPFTERETVLDECNVSDLRLALDQLVIKEFREMFCTGTPLCTTLSEYEDFKRALKCTRADMENKRT